MKFLDWIMIGAMGVAISAGAFGILSESYGTTAKDVFETFKTMLEKRELMELITEHYVYDNMVLVSLTPLHAAPYKGRLQCTATLQRVNQVKIAVVGRDPKNLGKGSTQKTAAAQTNAGTQNGKPVRQSYAEKIRQKSLGNQ